MAAPASSTQIHPDNFRFLQEHVYALTGIVLEEHKHYLVESRLVPIVQRLGLTSINELCALLQSNRHSEVARQVGEAMTTNETYFFREPGQYEAIRTVLLPRLMEERRTTRKMRFWSAAASYGQEAYSLAMLLIEAGAGDWNVEILGTDYSSQVLGRACAGRYLQIEVNRGLPAAHLVKYFRRVDGDWVLNDAVRRMIRFTTIDLRQPMRNLGPFDLVFCRNVMIYFDAVTKQNILRELHRTLLPGGWLLLGGTESALGVEPLFERNAIGRSSVYVRR